MKSFVSRFAVLLALAVPAGSIVACDSEDAVDTNSGKAISDLDIGSDLTLDKGTTQQVSATVKYADGTSANVTSNADLVWNVENTDVATISKDGVVTGVSVGATKIKATYQGATSESQALIVK